MSSRLFFELCEEGQAVYYSGTVNGTDPSGHLWDSLQPMGGMLSAIHPRANVWLSAPDTSAMLHYDASHNFLVQVRGSKTVQLVDSRHWAKIGLVSRLHPATRQAQANISQYETMRRLWIEQVRIKTARLSSGDVLFIPAFYFHAVTSEVSNASIKTSPDNLNPDSNWRP